MECLKKLLEFPGKAPVYLIMDALDECPDSSAVRSPRADVLHLIEELFKLPVSNLHICVTSRPETDINAVLDHLIFRSVSLHEESEQQRDIEKYIQSVIDTHRKSKKWKAEKKQLVTKDLAKKAGGM
jgi:hypothetical protein